jgi:hypothetical protein
VIGLFGDGGRNSGRKAKNKLCRFAAPAESRKENKMKKLFSLYS